jgi:hypothetical protein
MQLTPEVDDVYMEFVPAKLTHRDASHRAKRRCATTALAADHCNRAAGR